MLVRLATLVALFAACSTANPTGLEPMECPPTGTPLTYANFGDELIAAKCLDCHDRTGPVLTTQAAIQSHATAILHEAVYTDAMPENADMFLAEREKLGEWIACGAP